MKILFPFSEKLARFARWAGASLAAVAASLAAGLAVEGAKEEAPDLQAMVRRYADAMIDRSRSNLPNPQLPLFPIVLTRDTFQIPSGKVANLVTARTPQEFKNIANPHHDLNLYQVLYAL